MIGFGNLKIQYLKYELLISKGMPQRAPKKNVAKQKISKPAGKMSIENG